MFTLSLPRTRRTGLFPNRLPWVVALGSTLLSLNVGAQSVLTLDQALRAAQGRSRQLVAQDAAATAARELAVSAGQLPDPTLKLGINDVPVNGPDAFSLTRDSFTMGSIGVMQEFTRADKRRARSARYEREAEAAEAGRVAALTDLRRDTAVAWLDRYFQERVREVLEVQRDEARLQIDAADTAYRGGRGSQADVFAARAAVAQLDDRVRQAEQRILTAKTKLARWVGEEANRPLAPPPVLTAVHIDAEDLDSGLAHHPQLALMSRQEQVARAEADVAKSNRRSDWSAELTYSQRGPAYSNFISLNVSIPLQWDQANRQNRELSAKLALADQLRAQREEAAREHVAEVRAWLQQWQSDRERLTYYDSSIIPLAGERSRAALAAYRGGGGSLSAVLEARRAEIDIRLEQIRLEMEAATLWAQLEYLIPVEHRASIPGPLVAARTTATEK